MEDRTVSALIDLGSEATLVRKSCVMGMAGVKIKKCGRTYKGVSGKVLDVLGECLVQVGVTPTLRTPHIAVVIPDHLLDTDFLL